MKKYSLFLATILPAAIAIPIAGYLTYLYYTTDTETTILNAQWQLFLENKLLYAIVILLLVYMKLIAPKIFK
jgi:hypothetical protein